MPRERSGYRETLEDILEFTGNKRLLSLRDVKAYTGFTNDRAVKRRYPIKDGYIAATMLALCLSGGDAQ